MFSSFLSLLRKGLLTCMNFVDCTILSMSSSNSFSSSTGGGFLVDLKPYVSLEEVDTSGLRKKCAFQRILRRNCSFFFQSGAARSRSAIPCEKPPWNSTKFHGFPWKILRGICYEKLYCVTSVTF